MKKYWFVIIWFIPLQVTISQSFDAEVSQHTTSIQVAKGRLMKTESVMIRINNRAGERYTTVTLPFSSMVDIKGIEAHIEDVGGNVLKKLRSRDIIERHARSGDAFYSDDYVKEFTLKHIEYPYYLVYTWQTEQKEFFYIDNWIPLIDLETPVWNASLTLQIPPDYTMRFKDQLIREFTSDTSETALTFSWETSYTKPVRSETLAPPVNEFIPSVTIVPLDFVYDQNGSLHDWISYGDWQYGLLEDLSDLPQEEIVRIRAVLSDTLDESEKIRVLYHYLQDHTRYINISIETGGLKPYPASYVAVNKFGDCKALTNYFMALLKEAGIYSIYAKIHAGNPISKADRSFPSQQFNHIILCIPAGSDTLWLDCTSDGPFDYLGSFTQNRDVFLIEKGNSRFTRTPALSANEVLENRLIQVKSDDQLVAEATIIASYRGEKYEVLSMLSRSYSDSEKQQIIRSHFVEPGFQLVDYTIEETDRDVPEILFSYRAVSDKVFKRYGNEILVDVPAFLLPELEIPEKRTMPVQIDCPVYLVDTIEYQLPDAYELVSQDLPVNRIQSDFGSYEMKAEMREGMLVFIKKYHLYPGKYPLERYAEFYSFLQDITDIEDNTYILLNRQ